MTARHPFPARWCALAVVALLVAMVPLACSVSTSQAQDTGPAPGQARPDAAAPPERVQCRAGWCIVREGALRELIDATQGLTQMAEELQRLCGWRGK